MNINSLKDFWRHEAFGGVLLFIAAVVAVLLENLGFHNEYEALRHLELPFPGKHLSLIHFVNDALMALFFLVVGMEIKREILEGELSTRPRLMMPLIAAVGGMLAPALIFAFINMHDAEALRGWAIPAATDIAFAMGLLMLFGTRVPLSLKVFLTALAVLDDLGAIIIIALFYTSSLHWAYLIGALVIAGILFVINRMRVEHLMVYSVLGLLLWYCVFHSGIHATVAGVVLAFTIPLHAKDPKSAPALERLTDLLHPPVTFLVLPLFSFLNAGVSFAGFSPDSLLSSIPLGIALGLFFGKQIGVFLFSALAIRFKFGERPSGSTWAQFYAVSVLTGIGFTMSLFIGGLSYDDAERLAQLRVGVIVGSLLSAIIGALLLHLSLPRRSQ